MSDVECIDGRTKLIGLIATPIGHSVSPAMHNIAFRKLNLNYAYMAFEVGHEQLEDVVTGMRALNLRGFNVSMPNKTKIIPLLDELSPVAQLVGAVNTVVNENGKLIGHITDGTGYMCGLIEAGVDFVGKKMTLMGAGGAATAIAIQAAMDGVAEISIFNSDDQFFPQAVKNAAIINEQIKNINCKANIYRMEDSERLQEEIASSDILTNGTCIGMKPLENESLIPDASWLRPELIVSDLIYTPRKTKLLEQAESVGCRTVNGLGMVLWQGAKAFELWTGKEMPVEYIKEQIF
ncbi:shikimate dehydrogenase [Aneurinibacillus terranovensis]|uniref:shikimate dehydrogenase n=1 Tax=Aneurinibacillus terranovensis TaxID=278991 RepID=UPI0004210A00|nr:shikimate dehydrogenase [Aneurinibacillus terranovensis]